MLRRKGFTLAEVLIALLLVGILSAVSIQTLRNRDNSVEYEALRNKAITNIQGVLHEALFTTKSSEIFDNNYNDIWGKVNNRLSSKTGSIKSSDGGINIATSQVMRDGVNYAYTAKDGNSIVAELIIDVNGNKAPNKEGTDIFKYNIDKFGGILLTSIPDTPKKEYCPDGVTEKIGDGSNCPKCTNGSMVTTPDRSNCPKCPNGTTERNADGSNCDKCANGTMANADRSNCPKCANGQEANATRSNCPLCSDGTTEKNADGSNCPTTSKCTDPSKPYLWVADNECHRCAELSPYFYDNNCHACEKGYKWDYTNTCIPDTVTITFDFSRAHSGEYSYICTKGEKGEAQWVSNFSQGQSPMEVPRGFRVTCSLQSATINPSSWYYNGYIINLQSGFVAERDMTLTFGL